MTLVNNFVKWLKNNLELNVKKTKEMVIYFKKKNQYIPDLTVVRNENIKRTSQYKYLGHVKDNLLKGSYNTDLVVKKCN